MNWLKRIFCSQEDFNVHTNGLPKVSVEIPMPKVKPPKMEKDISEPVLSFVKCVRENPKRFEVEEFVGKYSFYTTPSSDESIKAYKLWDRIIKKGWYVKGERFASPRWELYNMSETRRFSDPFFLTEDEKFYIIKEVKEIMEYRKGRKVKLDKLRIDRRVRDERNRLKEIYK